MIDAVCERITTTGEGNKNSEKVTKRSSTGLACLCDCRQQCNLERGGPQGRRQVCERVVIWNTQDPAFKNELVATN